ncbi:MAG: response regulator [Planctomycetota bacterium]|nr:response regulator transcription factor [Planctomycetaceae bacterium]MDQ3332139.1 response regulator [Planctomycetota bacterium]
MIADTNAISIEDRAQESLSPTVFIIDDDPAIRKSLAWLVESVGLAAETYESASAFISEFDIERPGCLICDIRMPGMGGLELQERLRASGSQIPVIILTGYGDVSTAVRAMKAGATDFLEKPVGDQVLVDQIQRAIARDAACRAGRGEQLKLGERISRLTHREQEVMTHVIEGLSSRQIAGQLGVSFKTVEAHRAKVMRKMQAKSVPHLIRMSLHHV